MARERSKALESTAEELRLAMALLTRRLRAESASHELTWSQLSATARLEAGPATTAELARAEAVKPQSMGATLSALEESGLVERSSDPNDGRQVIFRLTAEGRRVRAEASAKKRRWLTVELQNLEAHEQRTMLAATKIIKRLAESESLAPTAPGKVA
jgi:DNA-binding MarR family transcriptional regulator